MGGTTGLGLSAAKAFIECGANLVIVGRNEESALDAKKILGKKAVAYVGDAIQAATAIEAIELCENTYGKFDGLYHVPGAWEIGLSMNFH